MFGYLITLNDKSSNDQKITSRKVRFWCLVLNCPPLLKCQALKQNEIKSPPYDRGGIYERFPTRAITVGQRIRVNLFPLSFLDSVQQIGQDDFSITVLKCDVIIVVREEDILGRSNGDESEPEIGANFWKALDFKKIPDPTVDDGWRWSHQRQEEIWP